MKMDQEKYWIILVLVAVVTFWVGGGRDLNFNDEEVAEIELIQREEDINKSANNKSEEIIVHIGGEVKTPGVFSFPQGVRLIDAISVAGGETTQAALDQINLARILNDGEHIIIPSYLNPVNSTDNSINNSTDNSITNNIINSNIKINLNQAGLQELSTLTGIGIVRAEAIIEYRDNYGGFKDIKEIMNVSGIGIQTYNNIKDDITI